LSFVETNKYPIMKKIENFLIFWECFFKNYYNCIATGLTILGFFLITSTEIIAVVPFIIFAAAFIIFYETDFGFYTYKLYRITMWRLTHYKKSTINSTYCGNLGCKMAEKKFAKDNPEWTVIFNENKSFYEIFSED